MNLYEYTGAELSVMLNDKKVSSVELTSSVFDRIDEVENDVGSYITLTKEAALSRAKEIDELRVKGEPLSFLAGIPIGIKDNICTKDVLTTCASKILYNFVSPYNATVMDKLNSAGLVMAGKLNMDEFAMGSSCENSAFKVTKNPRNTEYVPGGSSGGSAAAVAAGEAILSLGSDTGGSIRQPASYCGIVGLKPTYGSVSRFGLVAYASSLDQIGPLGKSVKDTAMLYDVIRGADKMDATSARREYPDYANSINPDIAGLKIGIPKEYFSNAVNDEVREKIMNAARNLERMGAVLVDVSLPSTDYALSAYYIIACAEASSNLGRFDGIKYGYRAKDYASLTDMYEKSRSEGFGAEVKRRIILGTFVLSSGYYDAYYNKARLTQNKIIAEFNEAFTKCDILLTPTAPDTAFKIGEKTDDPLKMYAEDVCTVPVNIAGVPAISVPCGTAKNGMPVGVQLIAPKFREDLLFNAGTAIENGGND